VKDSLKNNGHKIYGLYRNDVGLWFAGFDKTTLDPLFSSSKIVTFNSLIKAEAQSYLLWLKEKHTKL